MSDETPVPYYLRPERTKLPETSHDEPALEADPPGDPGIRSTEELDWPLDLRPPLPENAGDEPTLVADPPRDPALRTAAPLEWPAFAPGPATPSDDRTLARSEAPFDWILSAPFPSERVLAGVVPARVQGVDWDPADLANMPNIPIVAWKEASAPTYGYWPKGWLIVDAIGQFWQCTTGGTPGLWVLVGTGGGAGPCGAQGISGVSGVPGACGVSGVSGVPGACGVSGVPGACGVSGVPGACGVSGAVGPSGPSGTGSIADITSVDRTVVVTDPTGPTTDLSVPDPYPLNDGVAPTKFQNFESYLAAITSFAPALTTQNLYQSAIYLPAGLTISRLWACFEPSGTVNPTHWWLGLIAPNGDFVAFTADQTTTAIPDGFAQLDIATIASGASSTYTTPAAGVYSLLVFVTYTGGGSVATFVQNVGATLIVGSPPAPQWDVHYGAPVGGGGGLTGPPSFPGNVSSYAPASSYGYWIWGAVG